MHCLVTTHIYTVSFLYIYLVSIHTHVNDHIRNQDCHDIAHYYLLIYFIDFLIFFIWLDGQSWGDAELVRAQLRGFLEPWGMHRAK